MGTPHGQTTHQQNTVTFKVSIHIITKTDRKKPATSYEVEITPQPAPAEPLTYCHAEPLNLKEILRWLANAIPKECSFMEEHIDHELDTSHQTDSVQ